MGHLLGYARVSTLDQQPALQVDALEAAGCYRVFTETASGARADRPMLTQVVDQLRPGDTLVVWRLDRLGRSLRHLVDTVTGLASRDVGFRSLQESIDTTTPGGRLVFHVFASLAEFERDLIRGPGSRPQRRPSAGARRRAGRTRPRAVRQPPLHHGRDRPPAQGRPEHPVPLPGDRGHPRPAGREQWTAEQMTTGAEYRHLRP
jgi:DNA invertase Pin-like site-specific DNA recombinase